MKNYLKIMIIGTGLLTASVVSAHPDGATPFWYPSSYVYGFVEGGWETIEQSRAPITQDMWPSQIKAVCGCVIDALRHSITFEEIQNSFHDPATQLIVNATLPVCISEQSN